jgi:Concanavalin A-like lectin/glucanases superfamily
MIDQSVSHFSCRAMGPLRSALRLAMVLGGLVACPLWSLDELEREVAHHDAELAKAQLQFDETINAINDKALKTFMRLAQRQTKAGDMVLASASWKEVLRLQHSQVEARAFFTTLGTLDAVLADIDQPRDLLGAPIAEADAGRPALLFSIDGALTPTPGTVLTSAFAARTTEMVVGRVSGDGLLFEEGGPGNGQAIGLTGADLIYLVRAGGTAVSIKAPFERKTAWTHIAVQFNAGEMRLWLNGKLAAKGSAGFTSIPGHGDGGLGKGSGPNPGDWQASCQFALASFRLSGSARYSDAVTPDGVMATDKATLLAVTPDAIIAEMPPGAAAKEVKKTVAKKIGGSPPDATVWSVSGMVELIH